MPLSSTPTLLKQILSGDQEHMYMAITQKAMEWMVASFVPEANTLLGILWSHNIPHTKNVWLSDESLQVMWELSNQYPDHFPFKLKSIAAIETENWDRNITSNQLYIDEPENYKAIEKYLKQNKPEGWAHAQATACGALTPAKKNNTDKAASFIKLWGEGYLKYPSNYGLWNLMRNRLTAQLLLTGMLAPIFKLTKDICAQDIKDISEKLSERMQHGRALAYGHLSWDQILHKMSELAISQETADFPAEVKAKKYLGKPPASASQIEDAEKQLQVTLPSDYKEFLLTSNGFDNFASIGVTISPIDKVDYYINIDREQVEVWTENLEDGNPQFANKFTNSIIIGGINEEQQLLLIPIDNNEWECWFFANWAAGETVYPNFRFYMEEQLQRLESDFYR